MKRSIYLAPLLFLAWTVTVSAQTLNKVVASKHPNGKPELVYFYKGETNAENLVKQEKYALDGKKVLERSYAEGKLHGPAVEYKEFDGGKVADLNYERGLLSGKQVYYFSDGKPKAELNYVAGKLDGRQIEYWFKKPADSLQSEHNYSGGILHGMQRRWTKEGKNVYNLNFLAGKPDGLQRSWDAEGKLSEEKWKAGNYEEPLENWTAAQPKHVRAYDYKPMGDSLNVQLGKTLQKEVWYYETGAMEALTTTGESPETQIFYLSGKPMGKGKGTFQQREGKWEYWHQNGKKMMAGEYKAGKEVGLFERWDENGKLVSEEFWNPNGTGRETWKVYSYHPAGAKESEGTLDAAGHKKGKWKYWFPSGNKAREEDWDYTCTTGRGRPVIVAVTTWDDSGRMLTKGSEVEQQAFTYFANGAVQELSTQRFLNRDACGAGPVEAFRDGKFTMEIPAAPDFGKSVVVSKIAFYENGDTMRVDQWDEAGKRSGFQKGWYADGKPHYAYHYQKGAVQGAVKEWYPTGQLMLDHRYTTVGGTPTLQEGTYYSDKAKDYPYTAADGKKKKVMEEIDAISHFQKFVQEAK